MISKSKITQWLRGQEVNTALREARCKFPRVKVMVSVPLEQWDLDLADVQNVHKENEGIKYLLMAVDVLTRKAHVAAPKSKKKKRMS